AASQRTAAAQIENSGGADSEKFDDARERNLVFAMELRNRQSQRSLQTSDPKRSTFEFHFLLVRGVRRVVRSDGIDGAVGERHQNGLPVGGRAQRRVHLEIRVVFADIFVEQGKVVRRDFTGDASFPAFAATHRFECVGSRQMRHVQPRIANLLRQIYV